MKRIPISVYFMEEWWDRHYHAAHPRPQARSQRGLESLYLGRQRFLFEQLGEFGIGQERPSLQGGQIATVIRYGFDLVPVLLGTSVRIKDAWGFYPVLRDLQALKGLAPVDVANHPEGDWIRREKERLDSLYGGCSPQVDIGSAANNAFRIIGGALYAELLDSPEAMRGLFQAIIETEASLFSLLRALWPSTDPVPISNCNVSLMSPPLYEEMVLPYDAQQSRFTVPPRAALHHCDVPADGFLSAYAGLPGLVSLQASIESDVAAVKEAVPGCAFSAMVGPRCMREPLPELQRRVERSLREGADDFALWNIDAQTDPERLRGILGAMRSACRDHDGEAAISAMPLCWEEMEWAHAAHAQ